MKAIDLIGDWISKGPNEKSYAKSSITVLTSACQKEIDEEIEEVAVGREKEEKKIWRERERILR